MTTPTMASNASPAAESAEQWLAEGFARRIERWAWALGATVSATLAARHAALALSLATARRSASAARPAHGDRRRPGHGQDEHRGQAAGLLIKLDPDCRIALAAPTGKAAARMTEAIAQRASHLPQDIRSRLPADACTVHRLLGVTPAPHGAAGHVRVLTRPPAAAAGGSP